MIGGRGCSFGGVWSVDVCRDGLVEYVESIQLVHRSAYRFQRFPESVYPAIFAVLRENRVEDASEKVMAGVVGVQYSDRGDSNRSRRVQSYQLILPLLRLLELGAHPLLDVSFALGKDRWLDGLLKLRVDVIVERVGCGGRRRGGHGLLARGGEAEVEPDIRGKFWVRLELQPRPLDAGTKYTPDPNYVALRFWLQLKHRENQPDGTFVARTASFCVHSHRQKLRCIERIKSLRLTQRLDGMACVSLSGKSYMKSESMLSSTGAHQYLMLLLDQRPRSSP